ncbi:MAG: hypothetical protein PHV42_00890 [Candidatus Pacebacteria bacterium]|nr:hypothetical protein [Candidatus Paceibacterota bacterium]
MNKKGFIVPTLLAIIALLVIGGGIYIYKRKSSSSQMFPSPSPLETRTSLTTFETNSDPSSSQFNCSSEYNANIKDITGLRGCWFTPHGALRNVTFLENNTFFFHEGDVADLAYKGVYKINGAIITLQFDDRRKDLQLLLSSDGVTKYLKNEQEKEYFIFP